MSEISFSGPVEVSPELMIALWNAMPPTGQSGVAQLFFSRFVSAPISEAAIKAGAQIFFEREKIGSAGARALRDGVAEKCRALGDKSVNEQAVRSIVDDEVRKASAEFAKGKVESLMSLIPLEALIAAATPAVEGVIKALAQQYFTRTQEGQQWILGLIALVKQEREDELLGVVRGRIDARLGEELKVGGNGTLTAS